MSWDLEELERTVGGSEVFMIMAVFIAQMWLQVFTGDMRIVLGY